MRKHYTRFGFVALIFIHFTECFGQFSVDGEFRPRSEFRQGFNQPLSDTLKSAGSTMQRTRINLNYSSKQLNTRIVIQDSRIFGETGVKEPSTATSGSLGVYEAWAEIFILPEASFKLGRQGIQFEDGRLFSLAPWSNTGNSHDLAQLIFKKPGFDVQLGYAFNNQNVSNADSSFYSISKMYKQLAFVHVTKLLFPGMNLSLLAVDESFEKSKSNLDFYHRYTSGGTLCYKKEKEPLEFLFTGYYQFGKSTSTVDLDAFLLGLKAKYSLTEKFGIIAGADYYSGTRIGSEVGKTNTFNKLPYGVNHAFNGYMEYWASLPSGGLINYFGGFEFKPGKKFCSELIFHTNRLAQTMKVNQTEIGQNIGSELDLTINYTLSKETAIQFGWSTYFVNDETNLLKFKSTSVDTKFPQYAFLMFTIRPQFFSQKEINKEKL